MALSRRKSCVACAGAKRRCDLDYPACHRCVSRGVTCTYPWAVGDNANSPSHVGPPISVSAVSTPQYNALYGPSALAPASAWDCNRDYGSLGDVNEFLTFPTRSTVSIPRPLSPAIPFPLTDLLSRGGVTPPLDLGLSISASMNTQQQGMLPPPGRNIDSFYDDGPIFTGSIYQLRTEYAGRRLAAQPMALAQRGRTTFIHHTQVGASAALQDALAASALHLIRGGGNAVMVRQEIARRVSALIRAVNAVLASVDTHQLVEIDLLPPVQALLVYQCIRLFSSDDVTQQAHAERDEATLLMWARRLRQQVQPLGIDDRKSWAQWVREESVRRAVLTTELLAGVYQFLKYGWDCAEGRIAVLEFTAQAALWEAESAAQWKAALATSPKVHVAISSFYSDMAAATPDDLEELGIIIYAVHSGLDALEGWLGGDKGLLSRWGLRP